MKKEYDFSRAERGRFHRKNAELRLPVYLPLGLQKRVESLADRTGRDMSEVVNQIVESEMELLDDLNTQREA